MEELLKKSDALEDEKKYQALWTLLFEEANDEDVKDEPKLKVELLWRRARACYERHANLETDAKKKEEAVRRGLQLANDAMTLDPAHFAPVKWSGVLLSELGNFVSTKEKIGNAYKIRDFFERAHELKPDDQTTLFCLGTWHHEVASVGWMTRKIASTLFETVPESTYEKALSYFELALDKGDPWKKLLLAKGKTLYAMGKKAEAKECFKQLLSLPTITPDEEKSDAEAKKY